MRLIKTIPHQKYLIQFHEYNNKIILSIELDNYKQLFKVSKTENLDLQDIEFKMNAGFLSNCLTRFVEMRNDWLNLLKK